MPLSHRQITRSQVTEFGFALVRLDHGRYSVRNDHGTEVGQVWQDGNYWKSGVDELRWNTRRTAIWQVIKDLTTTGE